MLQNEWSWLYMKELNGNSVCMRVLVSALDREYGTQLLWKIKISSVNYL